MLDCPLHDLLVIGAKLESVESAEKDDGRAISNSLWAYILAVDVHDGLCFVVNLLNQLDGGVEIVGQLA